MASLPGGSSVQRPRSGDQRRLDPLRTRAALLGDGGSPGQRHPLRPAELLLGGDRARARGIRLGALRRHRRSAQSPRHQPGRRPPPLASVDPLSGAAAAFDAPPADLTAYERFVGALVSRYGDDVPLFSSGICRTSQATGATHPRTPWPTSRCSPLAPTPPGAPIRMRSCSLPSSIRSPERRRQRSGIPETDLQRRRRCILRHRRGTCRRRRTYPV